ncbi:oligopeptide transport system permease protein [Verrucomicrobium sp. GAS474]|uniref:ABC transporter permease n=1 Tax=Verrucomicrobium sp. GAS474 TaxID=1882831 RepID=UPI00087D8819|nr:ABC transporter permease subunit [Verrucomicrobium sp. GAS474]SDU25537.1 oligopeptide transport system permease protein [Verrucomicrobium sp. GAS474]
MIRFLARRLLEMIPVLFVIATLSFFLIRLAPGGPFSGEKALRKETLAVLNHHYGLDQPLGVQYVRYMGNLLHGDLGPSFKYPTRSVNELIAQAFPVSAELGLWALGFALLVGVPLGMVAALKADTPADWIPMAGAMLGICLPSFVLGPLLILFFAFTLGWCDASGWFDWNNRLLPALTLGIGAAAVLARMTRAGMLEVLSQDYIRTARAKGVTEWAVVFRHAIRGGMTPVLSLMGPATAGVLTGSFAVESIFQIPGLGGFFVTAAFNRDYTMVLGTILFYAVLLLVFNLIFDMVLIAINPRLKYE